MTALRAQRADDEKTGGWFTPRCLGDRLDDAEQKILREALTARRYGKAARLGGSAG